MGTAFGGRVRSADVSGRDETGDAGFLVELGWWSGRRVAGLGVGAGSGAQGRLADEKGR